MKKEILGILISTLLISTSILSVTGVMLKEHHNKTVIFSHDPYDGGWLEERDGVKIIHLNGSHYDMGYQLGTLLKEDYLSNRRAWLSFLTVSYEDLVGFWNYVSNHIPQKYKDEIQGRADALNLSFEETAIMEVIGIAMRGDEICCGLAAWGSATEDGKLYHFRSCDGGLKIIDPVSGKYACNDQLLIVRKPDDGYASVVIGISVEVGAEGGFNEHGIGIGYSSVLTPDITSDGIPCGIRKRMLLEQAYTVEQATDIYSSSATVGWNQIISDGKNSTAVALEQSANYNRVCQWNDSFEDEYPSWIIEHVIRRGNFFLDPVSAGFDEDIYKKSGFLRYIFHSLGFETDYYYFGRIMHYRVMSRAIEDKWGELNLSNIMDTFRAVYRGKTNLFYYFLQKIIGEYSNTWHQWVVCPETGDMAVSFSNSGESAFLQPVHFFNLYELINSEPP
jgi:hypothetical protein